MKTWINHETRIGGYLYPLRAIGVAMLVGALVAVAVVVVLVQGAEAASSPSAMPASGSSASAPHARPVLGHVMAGHSRPAVPIRHA